MILDSSALVALIIEEPAAGPVKRKLRSAERIGVGTPTLVETGMVLRSRLGPAGVTLLRAVLDDLLAETLAFEGRHWPVAVDAFARYGKGRHPAGLNLGDCFTYATAAVAGEPLLCVGDDFSQTDLELA